MKRYFVKRLPKPISESYSNPHVDYWDGQDSTALFLCSRDIQVGDKAIYDNKEVIIISYDERFLIWEFEGMPTPVNYNKELLFKVIGEISPDATWVKEGDEFDISDLAIALEDGFYTLLKTHSITNNKTIIKIKGPCLRFH